MSFTPPQPGLIEHAETVVVLAALRANLAVLEHLLARHESPPLAAALGDLRSAIARLTPPADKDGGTSSGG